ncbi:alpha/beta fold hydrolase [Edaphobacter aggregans]|uniref:alpha/beta fold hydrolase n=1 Tax=Edaphobacter aggregans TaxID=570835 RepID=UPI0005593856|nr:alpha/beta hydrolase [Edaphobacter aggregans]
MEERSQLEVDYVELKSGLKLRRMIGRNSNAKGIVLCLHGFPETIYAWSGAAKFLVKEFEVHAFDWPGYGLSSRPSSDKFSYSPKDYANVLKDYIQTAGLDSKRLLVYATDIGGLPALLLALEEPHMMRKIIVGAFAPFDRPQYMYDNLRHLKLSGSAEKIREYMNANKRGILENIFRNGLAKEHQFEVSKEYKGDLSEGWDGPDMTSVDAFYHYYSFFTRDQNYFEANLSRLKTPVKVVWGAIDFYIKKEMGIELAERIKAPIDLLDGVSHFPHLQDPKHVYEAVNSFVE